MELKIDYLMFHNVKDFLYNKFYYANKIYRFKNIYFNKIGVSVYTPDEFLKCLKFKNLDCIQIPYNILDHRWNNLDFKKIKNKNKNLKIHVRSIFLKGILPNRISEIKHFRKKRDLISKFNILPKIYKLSKLQICLYYILEKSWIDKIVIGVSDKKQILKIASLVKKKKKINLQNNYFKFIPTKILMPKFW